MGIKRRTGSKNPPILSHEFIIQNHADIVSCVAMVFVLGLIFQATAPLASMFVAVGHNVSLPSENLEYPSRLLYSYGPRDFCMVLFYFMICIVMHAIVQEYALDKINRKLHLSKVKHSKFNESGQLLVFYVTSVVWGGNIILQENLVVAISQLWDEYPHHQMSFILKFFYIIQICYWLHCYPELYFQKTKKEEMLSRIQYATLYLVFIAGAYVLNFTRVGLCLIVLHYIVEAVFHISRLLYFADKVEAADIGFMVWNSGFVLARLGSISLSVLTFWYGFGQSETQAIDISTGNFNTPLVRIAALSAICILQAWMMWNFITFHLKRLREKAALAAANKKKPAKKPSEKQTADGKTSKQVASTRQSVAKRTSEEDLNELTEVDQNTRKDLKSRAKHRK